MNEFTQTNNMYLLIFNVFFSLYLYFLQQNQQQTPAWASQMANSRPSFGGTTGGGGGGGGGLGAAGGSQAQGGGAPDASSYCEICDKHLCNR
jgi:uncharacterized membrane protein